jgi:uncharacterized Zn ribbon protein
MVENYKITEENASGNCPECGHSWDKGDVLEFLKQSFPEISDDNHFKNATKNYGWSKENPRRFSHLIYIEPSDGDYDFTGQNGYYQCPKCNVAWDDIDGTRTEKFKTILDDHEAMKKLLNEVIERNKNK